MSNMQESSTDTCNVESDVIQKIQDVVALYINWPDISNYIKNTTKLLPVFQDIGGTVNDSAALIFVAIGILWIVVVIILFLWCCSDGSSVNEDDQNCIACCSFFDLAKTAYKKEHLNEVLRRLPVWDHHIDYVESKEGLTLLQCACLSGEKSLVLKLLRAGADLTKCTVDGSSALYLATYGVLRSPKPDIALLQELIKRGCDVNHKNNKGFTALHQAARHGNLNVIQCLLEHGASAELQTTTGIYPFDSAVNAGHKEAAELLKIDIDDVVSDMAEPHTPKQVTAKPQRPHTDSKLIQAITASALARRSLKKRELFFSQT